MLNKTESKIIIDMKNIDNAVKLFNFLQKTAKVGGYGGDLSLSINGDEYFIGHDVDIKNVVHEIKK